MVEKEKWMAVPGYEGYYEVSDVGSVRSLTRTIKTKRGEERVLEGRSMILFENNKGYYLVRFTKSGKSKVFSVHQLVAMAFLNHKPCRYAKVVDHINNDRKDNRLLNLQVISHRHNTIKDFPQGKSKLLGVSWQSQDKKWRARIRIGGARKSLGMFSTPMEAHKAYIRALRDFNLISP